MFSIQQEPDITTINVRQHTCCVLVDKEVWGREGEKGGTGGILENGCVRERGWR